MRAIIFTSGYRAGDDSVTSVKGHRSDVYFYDGQCYYQLTFMTLERLTAELKLDKGKINYFTEVGLIILNVITKDAILKAIRGLIADQYFSTQKPLKLNPEENWAIIHI